MVEQGAASGRAGVPGVQGQPGDQGLKQEFVLSRERLVVEQGYLEYEVSLLSRGTWSKERGRSVCIVKNCLETRGRGRGAASPLSATC